MDLFLLVEVDDFDGVKGNPEPVRGVSRLPDRRRLIPFRRGADLPLCGPVTPLECGR